MNLLVVTTMGPKVFCCVRRVSLVISSQTINSLAAQALVVQCQRWSHHGVVYKDQFPPSSSSITSSQRLYEPPPLQSSSSVSNSLVLHFNPRSATHKHSYQPSNRGRQSTAVFLRLFVFTLPVLYLNPFY